MKRREPPRPRAPRRAGVTIPLFALRSARDWGIGEIGDLPAFAGFIARAGVRLVQLLPLGEISGEDTSPYAALSAFGIDPMYISLDDVPELAGVPLAEVLGEDGESRLGAARAAPAVDYGAVRALKGKALRFAFERFFEGEIGKETERAKELERFYAKEAGWLPDYCLFRAIKDARGGAAWFQWPAALAARRPDALETAWALLGRQAHYYAYVQWIAATQWEKARAALEARGMEIMGDLPFMVGRDSADVWAHQGEFRMADSVGTPPDVFDPDGQDWDLPPYAWGPMRENDFAWLRRRSRAMAELYHRFRIDHAVGFYRTYMRDAKDKRKEDGKLKVGTFDPAEEPQQLEHGERVYGAMIDAAAERGTRIIAEDLGVVPPFVRASLTRLGVPGYRVLIWEKDDEVFRSPDAYPELSVACFGTHDTDSVAVWWETREPAEREAVRAILEEPGAEPLGDAFDARVHETLLRRLATSGSELVLLLIQDVFGSRERINTPGTVGPQNWSYRLPANVEELDRDPAVAEILERVRACLEKGERS